MFFEDGFKETIGYLTEGRYLVLVKDNRALATSDSNRLKTTQATDNHEGKAQRWVIHYTEDEESGIFTVSNALDGRWIGANGTLVDASKSGKAAQLHITFLGNGNGYNIRYVQDDQYLSTDDGGNFKLVKKSQAQTKGFKVYSVTYHD